MNSQAKRRTPLRERRLRQQVRALAETGRKTSTPTAARSQGALPLKTIAARVIGRDASNWWKSLQLDRGSDDGMRVNCPSSTPTGSSAKSSPLPRAKPGPVAHRPELQGQRLAAKRARAGRRLRLEDAFSRESRLLMTFVDRDTKIRPAKRHHVGPRRRVPERHPHRHRHRVRSTRKRACTRTLKSNPPWISAAGRSAGDCRMNLLILTAAIFIPRRCRRGYPRSRGSAASGWNSCRPRRLRRVDSSPGRRAGALAGFQDRCPPRLWHLGAAYGIAAMVLTVCVKHSTAICRGCKSGRVRSRPR